MQQGNGLHSPLRPLSVLFFHLLLAHLCSGQSQLIAPSQPIVATVGNDIILPCHLEPEADVVAMTLEWTRPDLNDMFVHVRRAGQDLVRIQHPSYKGRTSVSIDELKHGNVSLKLSKVKPSDAGKYQCYIPKLDTGSVVELVVGAASSLVISLSEINRNKGAVVLQCESTGWYPEPEVFWLDGEGNLLSAGPTETVRGPDDLYTVSSRVTVEKRHSNSFTCRVQQNSTNQTRETHIHVPDDFFEVQSSSSSTTAGLAASLAVCFLVVLILVFFVWKFKTKRSHRDEPDTGEKKNCNRSEDQAVTEEEPERQQLLTHETVQMKDLNKGQAAGIRPEEEKLRRREAEKLQKTLKRELESMQTEIREKRSDLQQLDEEKKKKKENVKRLKKQLENKNAREKEQKKTEAENEVENLKQQLETEEKELDTKTKEFDDKRAEVQQLKEEIQKKETNLKTLKEKLQSNNKELPLVTKKKLKEEQQRREEAENRVQILEKELQKKNREVDGLKDEVMKLTEEKKRSEEERQKWENKFKEEEKKRKETEEEEKKLQTEMRNKDETIRKETQDKEEAQSEVRRLKDHLESKNKEITEEKKTWQNQLQAKIQVVDGLKDEVMKLTEEKKRSEEERQKLQTKITQLEEHNAADRLSSESDGGSSSPGQQDEKKQNSSSLSQNSTTEPAVDFKVDPHGKYIQLRNTSKEDQQLGGWVLKIQVNNYIIKHKFEDSFNLMAGKVFTVGCHGYDRSFPLAQLVLDDLKSWRHTDKPQVSLISHPGEIQYNLDRI